MSCASTGARGTEEDLDSVFKVIPWQLWDANYTTIESIVQFSAFVMKEITLNSMFLWALSVSQATIT